MLAQLLEELSTLLASAEEASRELTDEEAARAEDLTNQINAAKAKVEVRSAAQALITVNRPGLPAYVAPTGADEVEKRFDQYLRTGGQLHGAEFRALSEGVGSDGGVLVQPGFLNKYIERRKAFGGFENIVEVISTSTGNSLEIGVYVDATTAVGVITAEGATIATGGSDPSWTTRNIGAYKYSSGGASNLPLKVSNELLKDSNYPVQDKIAKHLSTEIARFQSPHWISGTGVGQPEGILTNKTGYGAIASTTVPTYGELVDTVHALDPEYRNGASFLVNDATLAVLRKMVDTNGRPLLLDSPQSIADPMGGLNLLGYRLVVDQAMPSIAATGSTKFLAFGNFTDAYVIRRVAGFNLVVLSELYALTDQTGFFGWERADGCVQDPNAYVVLTSHA